MPKKGSMGIYSTVLTPFGTNNVTKVERPVSPFECPIMPENGKAFSGCLSYRASRQKCFLMLRFFPVRWYPADVRRKLPMNGGSWDYFPAKLFSAQ